MTVNTEIGSITDSLSRRYTVDNGGADVRAIVLFYAGYSGAVDNSINLYALRVYQWPRATISRVITGTYAKDNSNTVTEVSPSLV